MDNFESSYIGELIEQFRERRMELGVAQTSVDDKIGVAPGLVAKWETGNRKPTSFNMHCWAEALGCILKLEENPNANIRY
tara:strand:- start:210 stop:449 length:240 start_codon:yes stop_codon:yes gene_type:complete